jgi:hypothetical protein
VRPSLGDHQPKKGTVMGFHEFLATHGVLKQNGLTNEPPDRFYSSALALNRVHTTVIRQGANSCDELVL